MHTLVGVALIEKLQDPLTLAHTPRPSEDLVHLFVGGPVKARRRLPAPRHVRAVDLNQAGCAIRFQDWKDLASVELGNHFHCGLGDRGESMGSISGNDDHVSGKAPSDLVADNHLDLS